MAELQSYNQAQIGQGFEPKKIRYARKLLHLYTSEDYKQNYTIDQFIFQYSSRFQLPKNCRSKLQQQLKIAELNHLKKTAQVLTKQYSKNLQKLQILNNTKYKNLKQILRQKYQITLNNLEIKFAALSSNNEENQELVRVKKLIQNGLWGCLNRLNDRIAKLSQLEAQK